MAAVRRISTVDATFEGSETLISEAPKIEALVTCIGNIYSTMKHKQDPSNPRHDDNRGSKSSKRFEDEEILNRSRVMSCSKRSF